MKIKPIRPCQNKDFCVFCAWLKKKIFSDSSSMLHYGTIISITACPKMHHVEDISTQTQVSVPLIASQCIPVSGCNLL